MNRRTERKEAFCVLFEYLFNQESDINLILLRQKEQRDIKTEGFITDMVLGVIENKEKLDEIITPFLKGWKVERISKTSLTLLRMAVFEINYLKTPVMAAVNEAVELAKLYDSESAPSFINGTLRNYVRSLNSDKEEN